MKGAGAFVKRHPFMTFVLVLVGLNVVDHVFTAGKASAQPPQPGPQPQPPLPPPAPQPPPAQQPIVNRLPLIPGPMSITVNDGDTIVFQLPFAAQWNVSGDLPIPLFQTPGSVLGGTLSPLIPTGAQIATWSDLTGSGTVKAEWVDAEGQAHESVINITAAGGAHAL